MEGPILLGESDFWRLGENEAKKYFLKNFVNVPKSEMVSAQHRTRSALAARRGNSRPVCQRHDARARRVR